MAETNIVTSQVMIFKSTDAEGNEIYNYRLADGSEGEISLAILNFIGVSPSRLPVTVEASELFTVLNREFVTVGEFTLAISGKAELAYVKAALATKVSGRQFSELKSKIVFIDEFTSAMSKKANLDQMVEALEKKAFLNDVYTRDEVHEVLMSFIGATSVRDIATRDALEYGMHPFVWVLDATDDPNPNVKSPALYKWQKEAWVYLGTVGDFSSGEGNVPQDLLQQLTELTEWNRLQDTNIEALRVLIRQLQENTGSNCNCSEIIGDGFSATNTISSVTQKLRDDITLDRRTIDTVIVNLEGLTSRIVALENEVGISNQLADEILEELGEEV